jgi:hypothetical protein
MISRSIMCLALGVLVAAAGVSTAQVQDSDCRFLKVSADGLNTFDEPRAVSKFIAALAKNDIVCVVGDQEVGDRVWAYIAFQLRGQSQHKTIEGWGIMRSLQPATPAELAAVRAAPAPPVTAAAPPAAIVPPAPSARTAPPVQAAPPVQVAPAAPAAPSAPIAQAPPPAQAAPPVQAAPPAQAAPAAPVAAPTSEVVRFSVPIQFGPAPVNGHSLEQLIAGIPTFPPIEGLDPPVWQKTCNNCHKWTQETLCNQASAYVKNPKSALRVPHPYGGPEKIAMMKWAETGCQ